MTLLQPGDSFDTWLKAHLDARRGEQRPRLTFANSPWRMVVDVRHDPDLDVDVSDLGSVAALPEGEHLGSPVRLVWIPSGVSQAFRVAIIEEPLGAVLLHSSPYMDLCTESRRMRAIASRGSAKISRLERPRTSRPGREDAPVLHMATCHPVGPPMVAHRSTLPAGGYALSRLRRQLKAWAIGETIPATIG